MFATMGDTNEFKTTTLQVIFWNNFVFYYKFPNFLLNFLVLALKNKTYKVIRLDNYGSDQLLIRSTAVMLEAVFRFRN